MLLHRIVRLVAARNVIFLFFFVLLAVLLIYLWLRVRTGAVPGLSMNVFDLSFLSPPRAPRPRAVPGLPWDPKFCGLPYLEADWLTGLPYLEEYLEDRPDSPPLLLYWRLSPREVAGLISLSCCLELAFIPDVAEANLLARRSIILAFFPAGALFGLLLTRKCVPAA